MPTLCGWQFYMKTLRIELHAIAETSMPILDGTDERYAGTISSDVASLPLVEFAETIRLLNECDGFQPIKENFNKDIGPYWNEAVLFLRITKNCSFKSGAHLLLLPKH